MKATTINRLILWIALAGMILALHLWIQKARGFDQGCFGFSKPAVVADAGCREMSALLAGHLLGVSNAAWGYAFYFGLALLSFAKIVAPPTWSRRLHALSALGVSAALIYSLYLVGLMVFSLQTCCVLCLTSAVLIVILAGLHVGLWRRGGFHPLTEETRGTELGLAVGGLFAAMGLLVVVVLFVNRIGTRPLNQGETGRELEALVGNSLPVFIDAQKLSEMAACYFERRAKPLEMANGPPTWRAGEFPRRAANPFAPVATSSAGT